MNEKYLFCLRGAFIFEMGCTKAEMYILKETMLCLIVNMALVQNRFKAFVTRFDIKSLSLCFDKAFVIGNQQRR